MEFVAGDKVKIKSYEEIKKMSIGENSQSQLLFENTSVVFNTKMIQYCGSVDTIASINNYNDGSIYSRYKLENHDHTWLDIWLDLERPSYSRFVESFDEAVYLGD